MTYKIDGTAFNSQPASGEWLDREEVGITGEGHGVYPALRSFRIRWDFLSATDFKQVHDFYENNNITGTVVATLPEYKNASYAYFDYTGCVLREPQFSEFFEQHYSGVSLLIVRIAT